MPKLIHSGSRPNLAKSLRNGLVDQLIKNGNINSENIASAFRKVPRHLFIHHASLKEVYSDSSLITKRIGIIPMTSSTQPSLMASMLEILYLRKGHRVLEIGTGTGYNAAILSEIVQDPKKIFTIDIDPDNVTDALLNLGKAGYSGITVKCQDGAEGLPAYSPYDRILLTCSVNDIEQPWMKQLNEGGIIVAPIWINGTQITPSLRKQGETLVGLSTTLGGFMKMRSETYFEMQASATRPLSGLLVCSEHPELFDEADVVPLLDGTREERSLPSNGINASTRYNFFIFLALHEEKSVELFLEDDTDRFGFGPNAAGIIDSKAGSACLISKDCRLFVYGRPHTYEIICSLAAKWERLGKPSLQRLRIIVYPKDAKVALKESDFIFKRKSTRLVVRLPELS